MPRGSRFQSVSKLGQWQVLFSEVRVGSKIGEHKAFKKKFNFLIFHKPNQGIGRGVV